MNTAQPKSVLGVIQAGAEYLAAKGIESPRLVCELLASRLLGCKRLELYMRFESAFSEKQLDAMRRGVQRVAKGEPVQYVTGQVDFMGRILKVDRRALIPRPETELLVAEVLKCAPLWKAAAGQGDAARGPLIADVGTGSGCIAIAIAAAQPGARLIAVDASEEALELARENATACGVIERIGFAGGDLADLVEPDCLDAVVSNPPYVRTADCERLPVHIRDYEPRTALDGGPDGLRVIRDVVQDAELILKPGGRLFMEFGMGQGDAVRRLLGESGFHGIELHRDLSQIERVVHAVKPAG